MSKEFKAVGHDVAFLAVNKDDAVAQQNKLIEVCAYPLFQDTAEAGVWGRYLGKKDDIYVYGSDGTLSAYLPFGGPVNTVLSDPAGYVAVKNAILSAK